MRAKRCHFVGDELVLRRHDKAPLQEQALAYLRRSIRSGRIARGTRMPSSRRLAQELGASRTTIVEVYEHLKAEGYLVARPRVGLFVADVLPGEWAGAVSVRVPPRPSSDGQGGDWRMAGRLLMPSVPAVDHFPWREWIKLSSRVLQREETQRALAFGDPCGEPALRAVVAEYLSAFRGIPCSPDQIFVASGSQPLVEMIARALLGQNDRVWFEEPGDPVSRAVITALGLRPVPVPVDDDGLCVELGRATASDARLAVVAPSHQYPLTVTMSAERRRELLEWACSADAWILENEIDGDYRFAPQAVEPLAALDPHRVIYLGSFNKCLAPGLRIGYAVVPARIVPLLRPASSLANVEQQLVLAELWRIVHLATHLHALRQVHLERRSILLEALARDAGDVLSALGPPEAGLRVTAVLTRDVPDGRIVRECAEAGVHLGRSLSACYATPARRPGLTIGFAATPADDIVPAVRQLAAIVRKSAGSAQGARGVTA